MFKKTVTTAALLFTVAVTSLVTAACASTPTIQVNGIEVYENHWNQTTAEVGQRASFDMNCPAESLEFTLFKRLGRAPTEVGVSGCGERATYTREPVEEGYGMMGPWKVNGGV